MDDAILRLESEFLSEVTRHEAAVSNIFASCTSSDDDETWDSHVFSEPSPAVDQVDAGGGRVKRTETLDQNVFLNAALQLLEDKSCDATATGTAAQQIAPSSFEGRVIKKGRLKKANDSAIRSKQKYVIVAYGKLTYFEDEHAASEEPNMRQVKSKSIVLDSNCRPVNSQRHRNSFLLQTKTNQGRRLWQTKSEEERNEWVLAIQKAAMYPPTFSSHLLNALSMSSDFQQQHFTEIQTAIRAAASKDAYRAALEQSKKVSVMMEWVIRQRKQEHREGKNSQSQVFKDMRRDMVEINGVIYKGAEGAESIIGALTRCLLNLSSSERTGAAKPMARGEAPVVNSDWESHPLTEAEALGFAWEVLVACNRTQSGGDSYDALELLLGNRDLVVLCPSGREAAPLRVNVRRCELPSGSVSADVDIEVQESETSTKYVTKGGDLKSSIRDKIRTVAGLKISVEASTSYKVCNADPQGDGVDDWAQVEAVFQQNFILAGNCADAIRGQGFVTLAPALALV
jgi:hypothetical protein